MTSGSQGFDQLHLLPKSRPGRWSLALLGVCIAAFAFFSLMVAMGQGGGETFTDNWLLFGPMLVVVGSAVGGAVAGLLAFLRSHERSLLVSVPILVGLLVAIFIVGEFVNPH